MPEKQVASRDGRRRRPRSPTAMPPCREQPLRRFQRDRGGLEPVAELGLEPAGGLQGLVRPRRRPAPSTVVAGGGRGSFAAARVGVRVDAVLDVSACACLSPLNIPTRTRSTPRPMATSPPSITRGEMSTALGANLQLGVRGLRRLGGHRRALERDEGRVGVGSCHPRPRTRRARPSLLLSGGTAPVTRICFARVWGLSRRRRRPSALGLLVLMTEPSPGVGQRRRARALSLGRLLEGDDVDLDVGLLPHHAAGRWRAASSTCRGRRRAR